MLHLLPPFFSFSPLCIRIHFSCILERSIWRVAFEKWHRLWSRVLRVGFSNLVLLRYLFTLPSSILWFLLNNRQAKTPLKIPHSSYPSSKVSILSSVKLLGLSQVSTLLRTCPRGLPRRTRTTKVVVMWVVVGLNCTCLGRFSPMLALLALISQLGHGCFYGLVCGKSSLFT